MKLVYEVLIENLLSPKFNNLQVNFPISMDPGRTQYRNSRKTLIYGKFGLTDRRATVPSIQTLYNYSAHKVARTQYPKII